VRRNHYSFVIETASISSTGVEILRFRAPAGCCMTDVLTLKEEADVQQQTHAPLSPELLAKMDAYWRAANYSFRRPDLPQGQSAAQTAAYAGRCEARLLGHWGIRRAELSLRSRLS